ncbi:AAA family ATPase [Dactylosporangium sp. NPDC000555]|uniref:AAA family ATPase n=1 Tax=Dactylosporangium sp. NPDC000555 TaxID=3154260 RepID=UPI0033335324
MLLTFRVQNFRSVRDIQELTLLAVPPEPPGSGLVAPLVHGPAVHVSPLAGVFGANASGKSTVLRALGTLRALAASGSDARDAARRFDPFRLDPATRLLPTRFEAEVLAEGVRHVWGCAYKQGEVVGEWLHAYGGDRRTVWYERNRSGVRTLPQARLEPLAVAVARDPSTTLLALAADAEHAWLAPVAATLAALTPVRVTPGARLVHDLDHLAARWSDQLTLLVARAGLGIAGVDTGDGSVRLVHDAGPDARTGARPLGAYGESDGTIAWLDLLAALLPALERGGVLLVDDLDAVLHPSLVAEALRLLGDPRLNRARAQLVFAARTVPPTTAESQRWYAVKSGGATRLLREPGGPGLSPGELARELWLAKRRSAP